MHLTRKKKLGALSYVRVQRFSSPNIAGWMNSHESITLHLFTSKAVFINLSDSLPSPPATSVDINRLVLKNIMSPRKTKAVVSCNVYFVQRILFPSDPVP